MWEYLKGLQQKGEKQSARICLSKNSIKNARKQKQQKKAFKILLGKSTSAKFNVGQILESWTMEIY